MFKYGDVVKIKPEWCDGELEKSAFYVVINVNESMKRCNIGLIDAESHGFSLGLVNLVGFEMIEKVKLPNYRWKIVYMVGKNQRVKYAVAPTKDIVLKKVKLKKIIDCIQENLVE